MTATELTALLDAADLTDADERLMLADAYEEAGRPDDAATLRADDADDLWDLPSWGKHVRQTTGYTEPDEYGRTMSYEQEVTVCTDFRDHSNGEKWESQHPAQRRWWIDVLSEMHRAYVRLAEARPEVRERVEALFRSHEWDLESLSSHLNGLIDEAEGEVP